MPFERIARLPLTLALACAACTSDPAAPAPSSVSADAALAEAQADAALRTFAAADRWQRSDRTEDPLSEHVPADAGCEPYAAALEEAHLEIDMTACRYIVLSQPAMTNGARGERLTGAIWHLGLLAAASAEAHVALSIRDEVVWEQRVPIPSPAQAWSLDLPLPAAATTGDPVRLHLHNHGANRWRVGELFVRGQ